MLVYFLVVYSDYWRIIDFGHFVGLLWFTCFNGLLFRIVHDNMDQGFHKGKKLKLHEIKI